MNTVLFLRKAKQQLSNRWMDAALGGLIYILLMSLASSTGVIELIVVGPLIFGFIIFCACLTDTGHSDLSLLFRGFNNFGNTLVAGLLVTLVVSLGFILLIVPGIILSCGFAMTFYIMLDEPDISGTDAMSKSWNMMRGHKWDYFCMSMRFLGWVILSILTCGIGFCWLLPYIYVSGLNFYRQLRYGTF